MKMLTPDDILNRIPKKKECFDFPISELLVGVPCAAIIVFGFYWMIWSLI